MARKLVRALTAAQTIVMLAAAHSVSAAGTGKTNDDDAALAHARHLLEKTILIDGHNDLPWTLRTYAPAPADVNAYDLRGHVSGQTDLARLRSGRVGAQFWSVYIPAEMSGGFAKTQLEQIDLARRIIARYPDVLQFAGTAAEIRAAHGAGRIASLLGIEGGVAIENSLGALRAYYDLGVRYMTLTHNTHTDWADSATDSPPRFRGLSPFGEEVVREMNRLGMLVDLSHVSDDTMRAALRVSRAPVIFSHSSARALVDVPRNVPDDVLRKLPENGGVVMVAFVASFVDPDVAKLVEPAYAQFQTLSRNLKTEAEREALYQKLIGRIRIPPVSIGKVADHIEHIRDTAGIDHVGIGADYDGNEYWPQGLSDVSGYPNLFAELIRRGWSDDALRKLAGENVLRVLERAEAVAVDLQKTTPASVRQFSK